MPFACPRGSCLFVLAISVAAALDRGAAELSANNSACSWGYPAITKPSQAPKNAGSGRPRTLGWWNMPEQDLSFAKKLKPFKQLPWWGNYLTKYLTFSLVDADEGAHLMFNATRLKDKDGGDQVPTELRGVWWMKGNGIAEELTVLQYGKWYPNDNVYVAGYAPMVWSWPNGKPKKRTRWRHDVFERWVSRRHQCRLHLRGRYRIFIRYVEMP